LSKYSRRVDGRYCTRVKSGVGTDGKSIYKALCANTEKELDAKVNSYLRQSERNYINPEKTTLAVWLDHWLHNVKRGTVTQATWEFYRCIIQSCINPVIGPKTLAKITPSDIRTLYLKLRADGLSASRINQTHMTINSSMKVAVEDGVLLKNPCDNSTVRKKAKKPDKKVERFIFEQEQIEKLLKSLSGWWKAFTLLAWSTGMRREELLGLRWMDVDTKNGLISIVQAVTVTQDEGIAIGPLKNDASYRTITVDKTCIAELLRYKADQKEHRRVVGFMQHGKDLVFGIEGQPANPRWVSKHFKELCLAAGLPEESHLHALRHTHATQLLRAGVHPKKVQYRLGHATYQMTMDIYSHVTPDMQDGIAELLSTFRQKK